MSRAKPKRNKKEKLPRREKLNELKDASELPRLEQAQTQKRVILAHVWRRLLDDFPPFQGIHRTQLAALALDPQPVAFLLSLATVSEQKAEAAITAVSFAVLLEIADALRAGDVGKVIDKGAGDVEDIFEEVGEVVQTLVE